LQRLHRAETLADAAKLQRDRAGHRAMLRTPVTAMARTRDVARMARSPDIQPPRCEASVSASIK
jgi:hypothetical protein